ncbi:MAG: serine/threonine protein kinase [Acidobacteria bacterium]|nr:serine/threonine protein kinase [Acidobacteriota bacterium]
MSVATVRTTMLYCPKCRSTYEEGTQRFCSIDGGRLLPVISKSDTGKSAGGVFTSILGKMPHKDAADSAPTAKTVINPNFEQPLKPEAPKDHAPISKIYETQRQIAAAPLAFDDDDSLLELDFEEPLDAPVRDSREAPLIAELKLEEAKPVNAFAEPKSNVAEPANTFAEPTIETPESVSESQIPLAESQETSNEVSEPTLELPEPTDVAPKTTAKLVNPFEIPSGTAEVGDRSLRPAGRMALSWDDPRALVGQTVKGRYVVTELIGDDEDSLEFLADDQIGDGRRVVVRVYMDDEAYSQHFAEERISLSHLNHPNIAAVFDSGELPEGFRFTVSEFIDGQALDAALRASGQFNTKRTARIIRQASYALSEAHENGILHRNLMPSNIMLTVSETGIEQVKLVNFELSNSFWNESDLVYKSPEEVVGEPPTFASEIFSLAVIAYEMLTTRLPFNALSERELVAAQEKGLAILPSTLRLDVSQLADRIIEKALSFGPSERYPKARDFGDAFFNALTAVAPWERPIAEETPEVVEESRSEEKPREFFVVPPINRPAVDEPPVNGDIHIEGNGQSVENDAEAENPPETKENGHAWVKRSPEPPQTSNWIWGALPIIGAALLLLGMWGVWKFLSNRQPVVPATDTEQTANVGPTQPIQTPVTPGILPQGDVDSPPPVRVLKPEPGLTRFVNRQENLKGDLAKNFLGFEIFYPAEMKRSESATNFLDIATTSGGIPVEQMLVTHYKSRGAMTLDRPNFKKLAEKSNEQLRGYFKESFAVLGEGETAIQNGRWKGYEVKFQGLLPDGKTRVFGRRLWIPLQSPGTQSGFVITLLATSLATQIKSVEDVGTRGDLALALENFEPEQSF